MKIVVVIALALACATSAYAKEPAAKEPAKPAPAPLPDHVEEVDYQKMQVVIARAQDAEANLRAAQLGVVVAQYELGKARGAYAAELDRVRTQYKLTERDSVADAGTHAITRSK
jgi:hypothetical protein